MGKKRQYRIVETDEGFFTQTRVKRFLFWQEWLCFTQYNIENYSRMLRYPYNTFEEATKYIMYHMNMIYKKEQVESKQKVKKIFNV